MRVVKKEEENGVIVTELHEIYSETVLKTKEGNELAVCMRDDTIEMSVVGSDIWYRADMQTGKIEKLV